MIVVLVVIFDRFYAEKSCAQNHRQNQTDDRDSLSSDLSAPHRHRHGKAADDQDDGVNCPEGYVEVITGADEGFWVFITVQRVCQEHAAEEHYFGDEEHPHAERARLALLLHVRKMVLQPRMGGMLVSCC